MGYARELWYEVIKSFTLRQSFGTERIEYKTAVISGPVATFGV